MVSALGHDVPGVFVLVFAVGSALAGLAGVIGGFMLLTQPTLANAVGPIVFVVVVVGGLGSLTGALIASMLIGILQTFAVAVDYSLLDLFRVAGVSSTYTSARRGGSGRAPGEAVRTWGASAPNALEILAKASCLLTGPMSTSAMLLGT